MDIFEKTLAGIVGLFMVVTGFFGGEPAEQPVGASGLFAQNASISLNLAFYGEIKPDGLTCSNGQVLKKTGANDWDCAADATGGDGGTAVEIQNSFTDLGSFSSLSFDAGHFTATDTTGEATIKLDWDSAGGPASLSQAETIAGNWVNTANPWADNEVVDTLTINGGTVTWTDLTTYPTGCTNQFVTTVGDTLTCASVDISGMTNLTVTATGLELSSDAIALTTGYNIPLTASTSNWETFRDTPSNRITAGASLSWDGNTLNYAGNHEQIRLAGTPNYITQSDNVLTLTKLDISDDTNLTAGTDLTLTTNDIVLDSTLTQAFTFNNAGSQSMSGSLNVAKGMTANSWQGGGLVACTASGKVLRYSSGQFSCGTLADADIPDSITITNLSGTNTGDVTLAGTPDYITIANQVITRTKLDISDDTNATGGVGVDITTNDLTFDATEIEAKTWGAGGGGTIVDTYNLTSGDPTMTWNPAGATLSLNFEAIGYASASLFMGSAFSGNPDCNDATDKLLWSAGMFTCGTDGGGVSSNSLDFDELVNSMTLDANLTIASTSSNYTIDFNDTQISFAEGRILSNGNVGIGTTVPSAKLDVVSDVIFREGLQVAGTATTSYSRFGTATTGHSNYISASNDLLISGDLEVDGSISAQFASVSKLFVDNNGGGVPFEVLVNSNRNIPIATIRSSGTTGGGAGDYDKGFLIDIDSDTTSGNIFRIKEGASTYMYVATDTGNVGIGTTAPETKFEVVGTASVSALYATGDVSALTFTDRTPIFEGDALTEIRNIRGIAGNIDHDSLPGFVKVEREKPIYEKRLVTEIIWDEIEKASKSVEVERDVQIGTGIVLERSLGAMISVNTRAIQQLNEKIIELEARVAELEKLGAISTEIVGGTSNESFWQKIINWILDLMGR